MGLKVTVRDLEEYPVLAQARSWLAYVRRSSPAEEPFTLSADIGKLYGKPPRWANEGGAEHWLIQYALDFVNGDTDASEYRRFLASRPQEVQEVQEYEAEIDSRRENWRDFLSVLIHSRAEAACQYLAQLKELRNSSSDPLNFASAYEKTWKRPDPPRATRTGLELRDHYFVFDLDGFDSYVKMLLLKDGGPFVDLVRRCQLKSCERFFLKKTGPHRPQERYHDQECMLKANKQGVGKRVRLSRLRAAARKSK
jgi:hypothetical protein